MSERAQPLGAEFTISVNGMQIGGVQTTFADILSDESQEFDVEGNFGPGSAVSIDYLNASNSLLNVENATINGTAVANSALTLSNVGAGGFSFSGPGIGPMTIGSGADTLTLAVAERAQPSGALFTVDVDGAQIGGIQITTADSLQGQTETINVLGNFAAGPNTVTTNYLNADNSLLFVDSATMNGTPIAGSAVFLSNNGAASFSFSGAEVSQGATAVGEGPDQLALVMSQRAEPAGADFTVDVDGTQIGGLQTVTADSTAGQTQTFDILGNFAPGSHAVSINYMNANNSLLLIEGAAINGSMISGALQVLSNNGSQRFNFITPTAPTPVPVNTAPDALALNMSEDFVQANAQFTVAVDGMQFGGVQTTTAIHGNGQFQAFDVSGSFSGAHTVSVDFLNAAASGGTAGTLYVGSATIDGAAIPNSMLTLTTNGSESFSFSY